MDKAQYKMVPVVPTDDMLRALCGRTPYSAGSADRYDAMLAAAPQPPSASGERELPPLPESAFIRTWASEGGKDHLDLYTAKQMQAYARAALAPSPGIDAAGQKPVAYLIDWPDEPDLGHYFAEEPSPTARSRALVLADAAPPAAQPSAEWMAEAERMLEEYGQAEYQSNDAQSELAALLAHLRTKP